MGKFGDKRDVPQEIRGQTGLTLNNKGPRLRVASSTRLLLESPALKTPEDRYLGG